MASPFGTDLIGHAAIIRLLESWLQDPAAAYLLAGPEHLGKRTLAERFAKLLLGRAIDDQNWKSHPDLVVLAPEEGKTLVSVEQVRAARERLSMRPMVAPRLVAYIPFADRLNESGTNALLKVLEEPPAGAVFILVAEDASRLPGTVKSRCITLPFANVPKQDVIAGLVSRGMKDAEARAAAAHGKPGLALEPQAAGDSAGTEFAQRFLSASSVGARLTSVDELVRSCESHEDASGAWRDALLDAMRTTGSSLARDPHRATGLGIGLAAAMRTVGSAVSPRLPLEACAIRLDSASSLLFPSHISSALPSIYSYV